MIFSENLVRQLYVVKDVITGDNDVAVAGDIKAFKQGDYLYFEYMNASGVKTRTDLINSKSVSEAMKLTATNQKSNPRKCTITVPAAALSSSAPIAGQDYMINVTIKNFAGGADTVTYETWGAVHVTSGMTLSDFYKKLAASLNTNFGNKCIEGLLVATACKSDHTAAGTSDTAVEVVITQNVTKAKARYRRLCSNVEIVDYRVAANEIIISGEPTVWATTDSGIAYAADTANAISNVYKVADLEAFLLKERGDRYGLNSYPNNFEPKYLVDITTNATNGYDTIFIHYAFAGPNEAVQKSEKEVVFVAPYAASSSEASALKTAINTLFTGLIGGDN